MASFVLLHSPLVGPVTWQPVAEFLRKDGHVAIVPELRSPPGAGEPYWRLHLQAALTSVAEAGIDEMPVLVAHSGAGPLVPAIGRALEPRVRRYIFADAAMPAPGRSRLDAFQDQAAAEAFRGMARDGIVPTWPEEVLAPLIPDPGLRAAFMADIQPMPLAVYEEQLPAVAGWPDARCCYLRFSDAYMKPFVEAMRAGWGVRQFAAGHFHMLEDPAGVAGALVCLAEA